MAETMNKDKQDGLIYDPIVKGYDTTFWKSTTGTPAMSSNSVDFDAAAAASFIQFLYGDAEFNITVPLTPTSGDSRQWGFRNPATDSYGALYFDITGTVFSFKFIDSGGNVTTKVLTWSAGYNATAVNFRIRWQPSEILVYINGAVVATFAPKDCTVGLPFNPLALRINNSNSDNMLLNYLMVSRAGSII